MGTNCAPLLADIFLYSYEAEFIQSLLSTGKKKLASQFNFTYRYIDDVLSINNPDFENYLGQMYPAELEIKDTTESNTSASYLDLLLSIESDGQLRTSLYDKRDEFNFHITNFPFLSSNIPSSPAYGAFISQLIRYARACSSYECFILRAARLSSKLLRQGYVMERLKSSLRKFYGRYGDLIKHYEVSLSQMLHDILGHDHIQWHPQLIRHYTYCKIIYFRGFKISWFCVQKWIRWHLFSLFSNMQSNINIVCLIRCPESRNTEKDLNTTYILLALIIKGVFTWWSTTGVDYIYMF